MTKISMISPCVYNLVEEQEIKQIIKIVKKHHKEKCQLL